MAIIDGDNLPNTLIGTPDEDIITGFAAEDTLYGNEENDTLFGDYRINDPTIPNPTEIVITMDNVSVVKNDFYGDTLLGGPGADGVLGDAFSGTIVFINATSSKATLSFKNGTDVFYEELGPSPGIVSPDSNLIYADASVLSVTDTTGLDNKATVIGADNKIYVTSSEATTPTAIVGNFRSSDFLSTTNLEAKSILGDNEIHIEANIDRSVVAGNIISDTYFAAGPVDFVTKFGHDKIDIVGNVSDTSRITGDIVGELIVVQNVTQAAYLFKQYGHDMIDVDTLSSNSVVTGDSRFVSFEGSENNHAESVIELKYGNDWIGVTHVNDSRVIGDIDEISLFDFENSSMNTIQFKTGKDDIVVQDATNSTVTGDMNIATINLGVGATNNTVELKTHNDWINVEHALNSNVSGDMKMLSLSIGVTNTENHYSIKTGHDDIQVKTAEDSLLVGDIGGEIGLLADNDIFVEGNDNSIKYRTGHDDMEVKHLINSTLVGDLTELQIQTDLATSGNVIDIKTQHDWLFVKEGQGDITVTGDIHNREFDALSVGGGANTLHLKTGNDDIVVKTFESGSFYGDLSSGNFSLANGVLDNGGPELTTTPLNSEVTRAATTPINTTTLKTGNDWISLGEHTEEALVVGDNGNARVSVGGNHNEFKANYGNDDIVLDYHSTGTSTISGDVLNARVQIELSDGGGPGPEEVEFVALNSDVMLNAKPENGVASNVIHQTFGHDWIKGGGGDDLIYGDSDLIDISIGAGPALNLSELVRESTNEGDIDIRFVHGNDTIYGGKGNDEIHGDTTDFTFNMDHTAMAMNPEAGYQVFYGNDVMSGGKGDDNFVFRVELNPTMEEPLPVIEMEDDLLFTSKGQGKDKILDFSKDDTLTLLTTQDVGGTASGLDPYVDVKTTGKHVTIKFDDGSSIKLLGIGNHQDFDSLDDLSNAGYDIHVETIA